LHHNAAVPKLPFCKSLSPKMLVGERGFEPRTSRARSYSRCPWRITAQIGAQLRIRKKSSDPE
jgi:hypothetical protein